MWICEIVLARFLDAGLGHVGIHEGATGKWFEELAALTSHTSHRAFSLDGCLRLAVCHAAEHCHRLIYAGFVPRWFSIECGTGSGHLPSATK